VTGKAKNGSAGVFVVEPHGLTRRGLCVLIERAPDLTLSGAAKDRPEALAGIEDDRRVAVIVVEPLAAPNGEGELIASLLRAAPSAKVMVLSARIESGYVERLLRAGVAGFVSKNEPSERVLDAIREVLAGKLVLAGVSGASSGPS
jgi:DNA-binding NarL/FixJ family response regulator